MTRGNGSTEPVGGADAVEPTTHATHVSPPASDPDAIRADIEQTRAELAETVDALGAKLNVKAQASDAITSAKQTVTDTVKDKAASAAGSVRNVTPAPVQSALDTVGAKAAPVAHRVAATTEPYRGKVLAGAGIALLVLLIVRKRRSARTSNHD